MEDSEREGKVVHSSSSVSARFCSPFVTRQRPHRLRSHGPTVSSVESHKRGGREEERKWESRKGPGRRADACCSFPPPSFLGFFFALAPGSIRLPPTLPVTSTNTVCGDPADIQQKLKYYLSPTNPSPVGSHRAVNLPTLTHEARTAVS